MRSESNPTQADQALYHAGCLVLRMNNEIARLRHVPIEPGLNCTAQQNMNVFDAFDCFYCTNDEIIVCI
jgi:hypothetical protein